MNNTAKTKLPVLDMVLIALFAALMAVCSWISIPIGDIPITLQTFGIFVCFLIIGGRNGSLSVLIYILLGMIGAPVFANFKGGLQALIGPTGGYIIGFLFSALFLWLAEIIEKKTALSKFFKKINVLKYVYLSIALIIALVICYAFGTVWFIRVYAGKGKVFTVAKALELCVTPYVVFDLIKIALAFGISIPVKKAIANIRR